MNFRRLWDRNPVPAAIIDGRYKLVRRIGQGSFGDIYLGMSINGGHDVAVKIDRVTTRYSLSHEYKIYCQLNGGVGIPHVRYFGTENNFNALVMDLLGPSLQELYNHCKRHFTLKTILMLTEQMLERLEYIHNKSFIHQDIKPDNFLLGVGVSCNSLFLIDFGLSKQYRDFQTKRHIECREHRKVTGSVQYASLNAHNGLEQSRRDDLESLGYMILYFKLSRLPWQGISGDTMKQKLEKVFHVKSTIPLEELCRGIPVEFLLYMKYCRMLKFEQEPDYAFLQKLFQNLFKNSNYTFDYIYDWKVIKLKSIQNRLLCQINKEVTGNAGETAGEIANKNATKTDELKQKPSNV